MAVRATIALNQQNVNPKRKIPQVKMLFSSGSIYILLDWDRVALQNITRHTNCGSITSILNAIMFLYIHILVVLILGGERDILPWCFNTFDINMTMNNKKAQTVSYFISISTLFTQMWNMYCQNAKAEKALKCVTVYSQEREAALVVFNVFFCLQNPYFLISKSEFFFFYLLWLQDNSSPFCGWTPI